MACCLVGSAGGTAVPAPVQVELVMVELAVLENAHAADFCLDHHAGLSGRETVKSKICVAGPARAAVDYWACCGTTAARLRFQEGRNVPELVSDRRSVDSPERAADVQPSFVLQHLHAAPADGGVDVLIDPRPWDRRHLRQIDRAGKRCS